MPLMSGPLDEGGYELTYGSDELHSESDWTPETIDEDTPVEVLEWLAAKMQDL